MAKKKAAPTVHKKSVAGTKSPETGEVQETFRRESSVPVPAEIHRIAGQLPAGVKIEHPAPHFPPELTVALADARKSEGRYMVAVWRVVDNPSGGMTTIVHVTRGGGWMYEWLLRSLKIFERHVLSVDPPEDVKPPVDNVAASPAGPAGEVKSEPTAAGPKGYE